MDDLLFDGLYDFENKLERLYTPPYSLKIKLSNYNDNKIVVIDTDKSSTIKDLPQSITELVSKYQIIQNYINCYPNDFGIHFDIHFYDNNGCQFKSFYHFITL